MPTENIVSFGSDNHSGIHPELLQSLVDVNNGSAPSYEQDLWSQKLKTKVREMFTAEDAFLVFNGTAANVLCIQAALKTYQGVLCTDVSHLNIDECGAPEKIAGCKLHPVKSQNGKFIISELENTIFRSGDQHYSQMKLLSLTQPTEYGTVYSPRELEDIAHFCTSKNLLLHIDGARLANAASHLQTSFKDLVRHADLLSFGGAKNGLLAGELVIIRNSDCLEGFRFFRKQSLQLPSKSRFFSAPFLRYLEGDLWKTIADWENKMAQYLRSELERRTTVKITQPTEANSVFCILPKFVIKALRKTFFFFV